MTTNDDLKMMKNNMAESVDNLDETMAQLDSNDQELDGQIDAVKTGICDKAKDELVNYLELEKLPYIQETVNPTAYLVEDPGLGTIGYGNTLSGWSIHALIEQPQPPPTIPPDPPAEYVPPVDEIIYSTTVNWDNDAYITQWMNDWSEANEYLTRPLNSGATYGLIPFKQNTTTASNIMNENKSKLESMQELIGRYTT